MAKIGHQRPYEEISEESQEGDRSLLPARLTALCRANEKTLNEIELNAVLGMIFYVAHTQNVGESIVGEVAASHYEDNAVAVLPSRLYQSAIEYLVDLEIDKIVN